MTDQDGVLVNQLALHRGLHSLAGPLIAMLRERLLREKLDQEVAMAAPSTEVVYGLEAINRYCELAENITPEERSW